MNAPKPWTTVDRETLLDCRVFQVERARARAPRTGKTHDFFRLCAPDWVNVVALTTAGDVVMVRQFRHGSGGMTLEIPGGMVDAGERPVQAALRELREETGYAADHATYLGAVNPNPALFDNTCHTYLARDARRAGAIANEGAEETAVVLVPLSEIPDRIRRGEITHALVIAAFHWHGLA